MVQAPHLRLIVSQPYVQPEPEEWKPPKSRDFYVRPETSPYRGKPAWDLTGKAKGGIVMVLGPLASDPSRWVIRCTCGRYDTRKGASLRRTIAGRGGAASCIVCYHEANGIFCEYI